LRFLRLLGLIVLAIPLLGGSCSFSSSNGDTTIVVQTGDCVGSPSDPSPCSPDPDPMAVFLEFPRSAPRGAIVEEAGVPAVPALGGFALAILGAGCCAVAAPTLRRQKRA